VKTNYGPDMNTPLTKSRYLPRLVVGMAVILSSTAGIAAIIGWLPTSTGGASALAALDNLPVAAAKAVAVTAKSAPGRVEGEARANGRCAECGVVVSTREIDARGEGAGLAASGGAVAGNHDELRVTSARRYEITIRMADRSSRVLNQSSPASWRPGEHVIVIGGARPSNR
jgi:hypothetical protein